MENPVTLFHQLFPTTIPSYEDVADKLGSILDLPKHSVMNIIEKAQFPHAVLVDQNCFALLYNHFKNDELQLSVLLLNKFGSSKCNGCKKQLASNHFVAYERLMKRCNSCRKQPDPVEQLSVIYFRFSIPYKTEFVSVFYTLLKQYVIAASEMENGIEGLVSFQDLCVWDTAAFEKGILERVTTETALSFIRHTRKERTSYYICSRKKTANRSASLPRKRARISKKVYDCNGSISFAYDTNSVSITLRHKQMHPCAKTRKCIEILRPGRPPFLLFDEKSSRVVPQIVEEEQNVLEHERNKPDTEQEATFEDSTIKSLTAHTLLGTDREQSTLDPAFEDNLHDDPGKLEEKTCSVAHNLGGLLNPTIDDTLDSPDVLSIEQLFQDYYRRLERGMAELVELKKQGNIDQIRNMGKTLQRFFTYQANNAKSTGNTSPENLGM